MIKFPGRGVPSAAGKAGVRDLQGTRAPVIMPSSSGGVGSSAAGELASAQLATVPPSGDQELLDPEPDVRSHDNGRKKRTPAQVARQERVFDLSVLHGKTVRAIAAEVGIALATVCADLRHEENRRAEENEGRREVELARSAAVYERVIAEAFKKSAMYDRLVSESNGQVSFSDQSLQAATKARERLDKLYGLDNPVKIDIGIRALIDAMTDLPD